MIARSMLVLLAAGLFGPGSAAAADGGNPAATAVAPSPKVVCRKEKHLGSHITKRICRTEQQAAQDGANTRAQLKAMQEYQAQTWEREELELRR